MNIDTNLKILVLTADKDNNTFVTKTLKTMGFTSVTSTDNGIQAIRDLLENPAGFVIVDHNLRYLSGWLFIKELKISEKIPNIPVILFGKDPPPDKEEVLKQYGVIKYLQLPTTASGLDFAIHSTLSLFNTSGTTENKYSKAKTALIGNDTKAVELYSELRGITANSTRSSLGLAHAYVQTNQPEKANVLIEEVAKKGEQSPTSMLIAAKLKLEEKNPDEARKLVDQVLGVQDNIFYYSRCIKLFMDFNIFKPVEDICRKAIDKQFKLPEFHVCLAKARYTDEKFDEALQVTQEGIDLFGPSHELLNLRGICLKKLGEFNKAIENYEEAIRLDPMNPKVYFNIAICCIEMAKFDDAIKHLESCLKISPTFSRAEEKLKEIRQKVA